MAAVYRQIRRVLLVSLSINVMDRLSQSPAIPKRAGVEGRVLLLSRRLERELSAGMVDRAGRDYLGGEWKTLGDLEK